MEDLPVVKDVNIDKSIVRKENVYLLISTLLLGLLFNFLFFGKPLGVSYLIFTIGFYIVMMWNSRKVIVFKLTFGWLLTIPILALSSTYLIFYNNMFMFFNFMAIPVLIIVQTTLITGNNKHNWYVFMFITDIFYSMFVRMYVNVFKPFIIVTGLLSRKKVFQKHTKLFKIIIGLSISIPLMLIVVVLLTSADQVFGHFVNQIPNIFVNINIGEFIVRALIVLFICIISFSYLWELLNPKFRANNDLQDKTIVSKGIWDPIIIVTILISINIIYVLFSVIQFSYLFGSLSNNLPAGLTYADYARKGFFELIVVTLINLSILLVNVNLTKKIDSIVDKAVVISNSLLIACTMIMLFSAHFRMSLYEEKYGYTYLRLLTHAFMVFIAALLLTALIKLWYEKISLLKVYIVIALLAYIIINFTNIDVLIARNNINRYNKTHQIDTSYLTCLSYDAVPSLVELLNDKNKNVAQDIENYLYNKKAELKRDKSWQSFNMSKYRAKQVLNKYKLKYKATKVEDLEYDSRD